MSYVCLCIFHILSALLRELWILNSTTLSASGKIVERRLRIPLVGILCAFAHYRVALFGTSTKQQCLLLSD